MIRPPSIHDTVGHWPTVGQDEDIDEDEDLDINGENGDEFPFFGPPAPPPSLPATVPTQIGPTYAGIGAELVRQAIAEQEAEEQRRREAQPGFIQSILPWAAGAAIGFFLLPTIFGR